MLLSVESPKRGSLRTRAREGPRCCTLVVWCEQSCRRRMRTCANGQSWFPRNLGEPCSLLGEFPAGDTGSPTPGLGGALVPPGIELNECNRGTAKRRKTKCGGMAAGRHSVSIVPMKMANSSRLKPAEESETPIHGTVFEKHDECIEIRQSCPRNRNG